MSDGIVAIKIKFPDIMQSQVMSTISVSAVSLRSVRLIFFSFADFMSSSVHFAAVNNKICSVIQI